jgi:DNA-binding NarL/FixJ family response regulator
MGEPIRVLIVDADALVRAALAMLLAGVEDIAVVGQAKDGTEVMDAVAAAEPDIVLMTSACPRWTASPRPSCCGRRTTRPRSSS